MGCAYVCTKAWSDEDASPPRVCCHAKPRYHGPRALPGAGRHHACDPLPLCVPYRRAARPWEARLGAMTLSDRHSLVLFPLTRPQWDEEGYRGWPECTCGHFSLRSASFVVTRARQQRIIGARGRGGPVNSTPVASPCAHQPVRCASVRAPCTARMGERTGSTRDRTEETAWNSGFSSPRTPTL
jgi:hypothetical protein